MEKTYYWIVTTVSGKTVIIYGGETEEEANQRGLEKVGGYFEVVPMQTRNRHEASARLKGKKLERTGDIEDSLERIKHKMD